MRALADALEAATRERAAVPDAATEELERIKPLFENLSREYPNECNKRVKAEAERDAALAALERVRAVCLHLGGVDGDVSQPAPSYYVSVGRDVVATEVLAALDGAPEPGREAQLERVAARLREIVYLCGDDLGCQCEEAQDASDYLARELSIIAAERPTLTADEVWAIARAEHDYANDSDNVGAFVGSLTDALRTAGVAFDEQPFIDSGYLLPVEGESSDA